MDQEITNRHNRLDDNDNDDDANTNAEDIFSIDNNVNDDKSPLINNTLATGTTQDETNDDIDLPLVSLHDFIDDTGQKETVDPDCHLAELFDLNIGAGGSVEITKKEGIVNNSRLVHLLGFSHRWTELDPKDRRLIILLLRDAIKWLLVNFFFVFVIYYLPNQVKTSILWTMTIKQ